MLWDRVAREVIEIVPGSKPVSRSGYSSKPAAPIGSVRLQPIRWRAAAVSVALTLWAMAAVLALAVNIQRITVANNVMQFGLADDLNALKSNGGDLRTAIILQLIGVWLTAILFLRWLYRARVNSDALGLYRSRWGATWIYLAWLIPMINLWAPLRIVSDLWREVRTKWWGF